MKQEKFNSLMVAIVAIAAIFGFSTVVWASFNETLRIENSSATIQASKWDIHFGQVSELTLTGTAGGSAPTADAKSTTLSGFNAILKTPGDTVSFTVPMENHGDYNATISSITLPVIGTMVGDAADIEKVTPYISVSFTYDDGDALEVGNTLNAASRNLPGTKTVKMTVTLDKNMPATALPSANVTVPITATSINFAQAA